jgi:hypothetical protein
MGWNVAGILLHDASVDDVVKGLPGGPVDTGRRLSGDEGLSMGADADHAVGVVGEWTMITDPGMQVMFDQDAWESLSSASRRALAFIVHSVSSTYGFSYHVDGRPARELLHVEGECVRDEGDPLPEESDLPEPGTEDHVLGLIGHLTGDQWWSAILDAPFRILRAG